MKTLGLLLIGLVFFHGYHSWPSAGAETFDMMTFTVPQGWERNKFEDKVVLLNGNRSCAIAIFKSRESSTSGEAEFRKEWSERVGKQYNTTAQPKMQKPLAAENNAGEVLMGSAQVESNGATAGVILVTYRGLGRVASVLVLNPMRCEDEAVNVLVKLEFGKPR